MALINTANAFDNSGTNFSSISLPATSLTTGNLIVVCFSTFRFFTSAPTGTVSDTAGNSYTLASSAVDPINGFNAIYVYYCANATGHASNVVTVTYSAQSSFNSCISAQYSNVQTSSPLDTTNSSNQSTSTTSHTSGSFTTTFANEIVIVYSGTQSSVTDTYTAGSGYAIQETGSTTVLEDQTFSGTQTGVTASITGSTARRWLMVVATFKLAAAVDITLSTSDSITITDDLITALGITQFSTSDVVTFTDSISTSISGVVTNEGTALITYGYKLFATPTLTVHPTALITYEYGVLGNPTNTHSVSAIITYVYNFGAVGQSNAVKVSCIAGTDLPPNEITEGGGGSGGSYAYMT